MVSDECKAVRGLSGAIGSAQEEAGEDAPPFSRENDELDLDLVDISM